MKILLCVEFYYPNIGGAEKHVQLIGEYLNNSNCKVEIATTFNNKRNNKIHNNILINEFKISGNCVRGYSGEVDRYQKFLLDSNYDQIIFYAAQQWTFDLSIEILKKIKGKKIFIPCGFSKLNNLLYKPYFNIIKNKINEFDKLVCLSGEYQDYKFCKKFYKKKISIINNGAEDIFFKKYGFRKKFKIKKNEIFLLYLSNIKFMKGQDRFIKILQKIKNEKINAFIIYANEPNKLYMKYLKHRSNEVCKLNKNIRINFMKNTSKEEKMKAFSECDYFICTSRLECSPLVMFEAMAAGKIFLGSKVGNCHEIQKKLKIGFVSNNINLITKNLLTMIKNKLHTNTEVKKKIYQYFRKNHNWAIILKKYKKLIFSS